ncbi:MAG: PAS domain S-box protein [Methylotenera sp.]
MNKKAAILSVQLAYLFANSKGAILIALILAVILAYMLSGPVAFAMVFSWVALVALISLVRVAMIDKYQRSPENDYHALQARLRNFRLGILIAGLVWGSAGILLFPPDDPRHQMFLIFILAGMSTSVMVSYSADLFSAIVFSVSVLLPLIIRLFTAGGNFTLEMGVAGTLYLGFIVFSLFHTNKRISENLTLHFEASERENAIKASDEWHRSVLNRSVDGFWVADKQGRLLQVNETYCRMSGYSEQELLTMCIQDVEAIESADEVAIHRQKIIENGEDSFESRHRRKDGSTFPVEVNVQYRPTEGGQFVVFLHDITQRKQVEAALKSSESHLRAIIENEPECIKIVDAHGRLKQMNPAGLAMIEADSLEQMSGHPLLEVIAPEHRKAFAELHKRVLAGETMQLEFEVIGLKGGRRWLETHAVPMQKDGEKVLLGVTRDISKRKQAEEALRDSEYRWKLAIEGSGDCVWDTNEVDRTITFSKAWKEMVGYSEDEVINGLDEWESRIHPEDKVATLANVQDCLDGKTPIFASEYRFLCKDGSYKWVLDRGVVVSRSEDGKPLRMIGTSSDISKRKQMEEALKESEYRWKFAIEGSGDGVWDVNVQTQEANYSKHWKEMLGFSEDEVLTTRQEWISRIHPDDRERVLALGQAYLDGVTNSYVVEYRLQCKDGQYKWMLSRGVVVSLDEEGKPLRMIGTQTDITEHKLTENRLMQMQAALQESHDRFKDLYEFAPIGYLTISSHGLITQLNWRASAMLGLDRKNIIHKRFTQFIDETDKGRWARMFLAMKELATGEELSFDLKFTLHNGMTFIANLNCARMDDADEQSMLRVTLEDISMVKKSEAELRVAATAFESHDGLMITDADNKILKVNKAFSTITGYSDEEVVGKTPHMLASGRHDAAFFAAMWESLNKTGRWTGEIWNRRKSGDVYPENLTITAVKGEKGVVTNYVATFTDISMIKAAADEIQQLAFFDSLTHLPNRRLLMDRLKHALSASARNGRQGAVLFLDLDHFKVLNDSLGHDIGDLLLQQVAERLTTCVREGDTVARLGGDEYVVVLEDLSEQDLEAAAQTETIANKILAALNLPYQLDAHEHHITPSIGIAVFKNHSSTIEELLKQADIAMYQAKKAGRNTLRFFNPQMQISITARVALERELRKAIDSQQLQLYYQIQVDNSGHPLGAEALIRWLHPERGLVSPAQFIPLAEETGLILPIGQWVLDTACAQIKAWHKNALTRDLTLSINVSAKQFRQADFVAQVSTAIERHSIDPMQLKLELTESLLLENIEDTIDSMIALGEIGVQFSLDDFGTGYSSLQYLKRLPLFQLKIDQSFVREIVTDSHDRSIVRTIIAMAQSLYLNVIAEGVETEEQRELLLTNGCKRYQGYLFGKPVPIDQFNAALKQGVAGKKSPQLERL